METRDIIVIGASAGGVQTTCELLKGLPADLPASIFLVQHLNVRNTSLADVLARCGRLKVTTAKNGQKMEHGAMYVAPPDWHLLLEKGKMCLSKHPRENRHRPSVDALFRSASRAYGARVLAVILSGALDDGTLGALAVKARGGVVIVQDPEDAIVSNMPSSALRAGPVDYCVSLWEIPPLLVKLTHEQAPRKPGSQRAAPKEIKETVSAEPEKAGALPFTCPECNGPLYLVEEDNFPEVRCMVGHSFAPESLSEAHREALERALLTSVRMLRERSRLHKFMAKEAPPATHPGHNSRTRSAEAAETAEQDANLLQEILERI